MEVHLMTDMTSGVENVEDSTPGVGLDGTDEQLVARCTWAIDNLRHRGNPDELVRY
jgi:hypothetical protein